MRIGRQLLALVAAGILAGCAGGSTTSVPAGGSSLQSHSSTLGAGQTSAMGEINDGKCKTSGDVTVSPCPVVLTVSNPSVTVTVTAGSGDTITEKDNCTKKKNIATVEGTNGTYQVTAGDAAGSCQAKFTAKNGKTKTGSGTLPIKNGV